MQTTAKLFQNNTIYIHIPCSFLESETKMVVREGEKSEMVYLQVIMFVNYAFIGHLVFRFGEAIGIINNLVEPPRRVWLKPGPILLKCVSACNVVLC